MDVELPMVGKIENIGSMWTEQNAWMGIYAHVTWILSINCIENNPHAQVM
jgi:hypothetical protein